MPTTTATDARKSFFDLMKGVNQKHEIYHFSRQAEKDIRKLTPALTCQPSSDFVLSGF